MLAIVHELATGLPYERKPKGSVEKPVWHRSCKGLIGCGKNTTVGTSLKKKN